MILQPQIVTQNDYGYELPFTLQDGNGNAVSLSGVSTLVFTVQDSQDPNATALFAGDMTVDSATDGTCHYTVAAGNFSNPGTLLATITATWPASEVLTWTGIKIIVEPSLPKTIN
jgi:hypothetical protein